MIHRSSLTPLVLISGDLSLQWLEAGFWFSVRGIEARLQQWEHGTLITRPPGPVAKCVEMSFHIEMESSETNRVFIRRKKSTVFVDRWLRVAPRGSSHHFFFCLFCSHRFYWAFLPRFLWPVVLLCLVLSLYLVYLRVLLFVMCISKLRWIPGKRPMNRLTSLTMKRCSYFDHQGAFLHMWRREGLLDFENEKYVVFYLLRAQPPPLSYFYGVSDNYGASVYRGETVQPGSHLSPASKDVLIPWSSAAAAAKHFSCIQLFVTP